jgi:hypothetical protein
MPVIMQFFELVRMERNVRFKMKGNSFFWGVETGLRNMTEACPRDPVLWIIIRGLERREV